MSGRYPRRQAEPPELPETADKTLAYFALLSNRKLSPAAKSVGGCLVNHFNRKTGRCDPGIETIAREIGYNRSTVFKAVTELEDAGYLRRIRHGGKWSTNSYEIIWSKFRQTKAFDNRVVSRSQNCDHNGRKNETANGRENATQTFEGTSEDKPLKRRLPKKRDDNRSGQSFSHPNIQNTRISNQASSSDVMVEKAEQRWEENLRQTLGENFAEAVKMITPELAAAATQHELQHRERGHEVVLSAMRAEWLDVSE